MELCRFLRFVKFAVRPLGRFLGLGVCLCLRVIKLSKMLDKTLAYNHELQEVSIRPLILCPCVAKL